MKQFNSSTNFLNALRLAFLLTLLTIITISNAIDDSNDTIVFGLVLLDLCLHVYFSIVMSSLYNKMKNSDEDTNLFDLTFSDPTYRKASDVDVQKVNNK